MTIPPTPLDYSLPRRPPRPPGSWGLFSLGVLAGLVFSATYYLGMGRLGLFGRFPWAALGAIAVKVAAASVLLRSSWRSFAIGLFASIPIAVLIFVGVCFVELSKI